MNALQFMERELNISYTENGDIAYNSTGSACLDFFYLCGGMRNRAKFLCKFFVKAYAENPVIAIKILFYMRNIRGGLGERYSFRLLLTELGKYYPETAKKVLYAIPEYGRWDDIFVLLETPVKEDAINLIKNQIEKDNEAIKQGKEVSLLGKWLPSVNTSSKESVALAKKLIKALGMKAVDYRKLCSSLRREIKIIEDNLRRRDYTFDYSKQPSQAMVRYKKAFIRNDGERYQSFLNKVLEQAVKIAKGEEIPEEEKVKLNTKTLYPYQIVAPFYAGLGWKAINVLSESEKLALEASWKALDRKSFGSKTIVVRDGSGSMYHGGDDSPINIATSLALLFAEQLTGSYRNSFITFSNRPQLVQIPENCDSLEQKLHFIHQFNEVANTDIGKVYELLLKTAKSGEVSKEEMIERIVIISDMEFDFCAEGVSTFDYWKNEFEKAGYKLPEVVFWNVESRNSLIPVTENAKGVKLVSGASANILESVMSGELKVVTPYEFMLKMLEPYSEFDKLAG